MRNLTTELDDILGNVTAGPEKGRVPGVVAMVTDRNHNIYEGSAGTRSLATG